MKTDNNWELVLQFPRPQEAEFDALFTRLIPEGIIRIWHPVKRAAWYRLTIPEKNLQRLAGVLQKLQSIETIQVFVNRQQVSADALWAFNCYANPQNIYRLCEMQRTPDLVIGCPQGFLSLEAHSPSAWYLKLKPAHPENLNCWVLGEESWEDYLKSRLGHFHVCPELQRRGNLHYLEKLPTQLEMVEYRDIFSVVNEGTKPYLRVRNRDTYERWVAGSILQ